MLGMCGGGEKVRFAIGLLAAYGKFFASAILKLRSFR
jgi:hypothetical protein